MIVSLMKGTSLTAIVVVVVVVVIASHLLCFPRHRTAEIKCQTVILHRVIEKSPCDPSCFTSMYSMSANRLNVLVTLMIAVAFLVAESGNARVDAYPQYSSNRQAVSAPQRYCGKRLSNALHVICDGVYNSMFKKSGQAQEEANAGRMSTSFDYVRAQEMELADYPLVYADFHGPPFLPANSARDMINGRFGDRRSRRETRGIHEECCINACTISELSSYCGPKLT